MGRPEREARFSSELSASKKKRRVLMQREPVGDGLLLQFLEHEGVVQRGGQQVGQRIHDQPVCRREGILFVAFHVQHAEQVFAVGNRDAKNGARSRQHALQLRFARGLDQRRLAGPRHPAENARSQRDALAQRLRGDAGLGLDFDVLGRRSRECRCRCGRS